jgi:hypothetical protein
MEKVNLIYNLIVIIMAIIMFFINISGSSAIIDLLLKAIAKIGSVFCILYAGVQIFKFFGII